MVKVIQCGSSVNVTWLCKQVQQALRLIAPRLVADSPGGQTIPTSHANHTQPHSHKQWWVHYTISDWEFETFWPLAKFHHNRYTPGLQILCSCVYVSHEHEYIFYFFIVQLWKLTEASQSSKAIVSGDWNGCHIKVTSNFQIPPFGECGLCTQTCNVRCNSHRGLQDGS